MEEAEAMPPAGARTSWLRRLGVLLTVLLLGLAGGYAFCVWRDPGISVRVVVDGDDVSNAGASSVLIKSGRHWLELACKTTCPNIVEHIRTPEGLVRLEFRDEAGACVLCSSHYVTTNSRMLTVKNVDGLTVIEKHGRY